jgi:acetyl esterase/lipase
MRFCRVHFLIMAGCLVGCASPRTPRASVDASPAATGRTMISFAEVAATPAPAADLREPYGPDASQFGELRLAAGTTARGPVVVLIHGGCWRAAYNLAHVAAAAAALADRGYAVWVPEYRRVGNDGGGWPGTFDDIGAAVDHLRHLAARYPTLDTTRVVLVGHSAGGHLALWAATRRVRDPLSATGAPLRVTGIVSLAGITDLAAFGAATGGCNSAVTPLMGGTSTQFPERYSAASPIERLPIGVPVCIVHGAADPIVPLSQSREFATRSRQAGGAVTVVEVPGAGHFDLVAPQSSAFAAVLEAVRALAAPNVNRRGPGE